jgi:hypothetical protein
MSTRGVLLLIALGLIALGMLLGIAALIFPDGWLPEEVIASIFICGAYTLGALVAVSVGARMRRTRTACLALAVLSMGGFLTGVWLGGLVGWETIDTVFRWSAVGLIAALGLLHRMIIGGLTPRSGLGRLCRRVAVVSGAVTAGGLASVVAMADLLYEWDELIVRVLGIGGIVVTGSSIAAGLIAFLERRPGEDEPGVLGDGVPVSLDCPRCAVTIEARSGKQTRCGGCRLRVRVEVEEPRCACGYLLFQLTGDTCPECGKAVDPADRWPARAEPARA